MKHLGDIRGLSSCGLPPVDVVTGGSPCQDLSVAGAQKGLAGKRSGLFMEQIRIVKELRNADIQRGRTGSLIRPRFMVWENVPGAFSSNKGQDFQKVLTETIRIAAPNAPDVPHPERWPLADAYFGSGWSVAYRVFDAQFWGVAQRRRRICLVADFGGFAAPEILFVRQSVQGNPEPCGATWEGTAASLESGSDSAGGVSGCHVSVSPALSECAVPIHDKATRYKGGGSERNGDGAGNGLGVGHDGDPCFTLTAADRHAVYDARGNGDGKTACTLTGDHQNRVTDYTAIVVAVDCRCGTESEVNGTLQAKGSGGYSLNTNNTIRQGEVVRRLTPLECERLQGFPDGWTDIGEWTDSKGKVHKTSDAARYKALGNSIALPPWKWALKRISAQYERDATLGSLFDGIGGFPLLWEQINGRGSALWASEIDEFPIAVTKRRFGNAE